MHVPSPVAGCQCSLVGIIITALEEKNCDVIDPDFSSHHVRPLLLLQLQLDLRGLRRPRLRCSVPSRICMAATSTLPSLYSLPLFARTPALPAPATSNAARTGDGLASFPCCPTTLPLALPQPTRQRPSARSLAALGACPLPVRDPSSCAAASNLRCWGTWLVGSSAPMPLCAITLTSQRAPSARQPESREMTLHQEPGWCCPCCCPLLSWLCRLGSRTASPRSWVSLCVQQHWSP